MKIRSFNKTTDYAMLCDWWRHWGHEIADVSELPNSGFVVYTEELEVMCGFLVLTNAKFAMLETVAANPRTNFEDRTDAIGKLTDHIASLARGLGYRRILAFPQKTRLVEKGKLAGFQAVPGPATICVKEL